MTFVTTDKLTAREIVTELGILVADVDKPLASSDICALTPFLQKDPQTGEKTVPILVDTWLGYVGKARQERKAGRDRPGLAPEPDGYLGRTPYWYPETIARYTRSRRGQGKGGGRPSHRASR